MGTPSADRRWLWVGLIVLVVGHLPTLGAGFVNREWAFAEATRTLLDPGYEEGLHKYCGQQANPLGYSLTTAGLLGVTGLPVAFWTVRLPSLAGGCLLLFAGYRLAGARPAAGGGRFGLWVAVVVSNPLVWCYTGQATVDALPAAIGLRAGTEAFRAGGRGGTSRRRPCSASAGWSSSTACSSPPGWRSRRGCRPPATPCPPAGGPGWRPPTC